jgi:phage gp36-like protein
MAYATRTDFEQLGLPPDALDALDSRVPGSVARALDAASTLADGYLRARYVLPLSSWGDDLTQAVCAVAAASLMMTLGLDPESPTATMIRERSKEARRWFEMVAAKKIHPTVTEGGAPVDGAVVISPAARGWDNVEIEEERGW